MEALDGARRARPAQLARIIGAVAIAAAVLVGCGGDSAGAHATNTVGHDAGGRAELAHIGAGSAGTGTEQRGPEQLIPGVGSAGMGGSAGELGSADAGSPSDPDAGQGSATDPPSTSGATSDAGGSSSDASDAGDAGATSDAGGSSSDASGTSTDAGAGDAGTLAKCNTFQATYCTGCPPSSALCSAGSGYSCCAAALPEPNRVCACR